MFKKVQRNWISKKNPTYQEISGSFGRWQENAHCKFTSLHFYLCETASENYILEKLVLVVHYQTKIPIKPLNTISMNSLVQ